MKGAVLMECGGLEWSLDDPPVCNRRRGGGRWTGLLGEGCWNPLLSSGTLVGLPHGSSRPKQVAVFGLVGCEPSRLSCPGSPCSESVNLGRSGFEVACAIYRDSGSRFLFPAEAGTSLLPAEGSTDGGVHFWASRSGWWVSAGLGRWVSPFSIQFPCVRGVMAASALGACFTHLRVPQGMPGAFRGEVAVSGGHGDAYVYLESYDREFFSV